jgi:HTH-type transcriptional regulator/antitoxin HipB
MTSVTEYRINEPRRLGRALREERRKRGLTQEDLADRARVSRGWLIKFEQGHGTAELDPVFRIIGALGLTLSLAPRRASEQESVSQDAFDRMFNG